MPDSRPSVPDLLDVIRGYLERDLLPTVDSYHQFQLRIAARLLTTIGHELALGPAAAADERLRLARLLGREGDFAELNAELARRIRAGDMPVDDPALLAHLRRSTEDALRINNPKWLVSPPGASSQRV